MSRQGVRQKEEEAYGKQQEEMPPLAREPRVRHTRHPLARATEVILQSWDFLIKSSKILEKIMKKRNN